MKLSDLKQPELLKLAEDFGTDADETLNEAQIIARLVEDGMTQELFDTFVEGRAAAEAAEAGAPQEVESTEKTPKKRAKKEEKQPEQVLLYMERENPTYRVRGYTFTREHPFALVKEKDADFITSHEEGFRYATPREAAEFYS